MRSLSRKDNKQDRSKVYCLEKFITFEVEKFEENKN